MLSNNSNSISMTLVAEERDNRVAPCALDDPVIAPSPMPAPPRRRHRLGTTTTTTTATTTTAATTTTTAAATTLQQPQTRDRRSVDHSPSSVRAYHRVTFSARIVRPSLPSSSSSSSFISSRYVSTRSVLSLTVTRCRDSRHPSPLLSLPLLTRTCVRETLVRSTGREDAHCHILEIAEPRGTERARAQGRYFGEGEVRCERTRSSEQTGEGKTRKGGGVGKDRQLYGGRERGRTVGARESGKLHFRAARRSDASCSLLHLQQR